MHVVPQEVVQFRGKLSARGSTSNHDKRQEPRPLRLRGAGVGRALEALDDAGADGAGVRELFQEVNIVLLRDAGDVEGVGGGADGDDDCVWI